MTVATQNAINALYDLAIPADLLVHLACQAEYGTGVRAGSLDQATEQKGRAGQGTLISSNPRDNYRVIGTYPVPTDRFQILFPYAAERDRSAWRWSWGAYAETAGAGPLTTSETRKMTGKAAELAAILVRLPFSTDFFKPIEDDLVASGLLSLDSRAWIASVLRQVPLRAGTRSCDSKRWNAAAGTSSSSWKQTASTSRRQRRRPMSPSCRSLPVGATRSCGERCPTARSSPRRASRCAPCSPTSSAKSPRTSASFTSRTRGFEWVTRSQKGDRSVSIDPERLPSREAMHGELDWERGRSGPDRLNLWLERFAATPFDFNRGLDDETLAAADPPEFHDLEGSSFFRGLALIDLAEAMLKRAFGPDAVAVRVNAAGQGDYFQVHVDTEAASPAQVRRFISAAFYRRFGLAPDPEFVEIHPGGGRFGHAAQPVRHPAAAGPAAAVRLTPDRAGRAGPVRRPAPRTRRPRPGSSARPPRRR